MGPGDSKPGVSDVFQDRVPSSPLPGPLLPCDMEAVSRGTHALQTLWLRMVGTGGREKRLQAQPEVVPSLSAIGNIEFCFVLCVWFCFLNN